jgi:hypothetical protein
MLTTAKARKDRMKEKENLTAGPDKMSGSLKSMDDESLAGEFKRRYDIIGKRLMELRPICVELRNRFFKLPKGGSIMGCKTWTGFCEQHLKYSGRHVRRLIEGDNPATDKHRPKNETDSLPKPSQSLPDMPPAHNADWTDNEYIKICVRFVGSTLRPLESDPQRFHHVAVAIAQEIAGDLWNPHDGPAQDGCEPSGVTQ